MPAFSLASKKDTIQAIILCCQLFMLYSCRVAAPLHFSCPDYDVIMTDFIRNMYGIEILLLHK